MQTDILKTVKDQFGKKDAEEKMIYTKDEIKEIKEKINSYLAPKNILTFKHLQNILQIVNNLMALENLLKKSNGFFSKLIIKLDGINQAAQLKLNFLASLRRVKVFIQSFNHCSLIEII